MEILSYLCMSGSLIRVYTTHEQAAPKINRLPFKLTNDSVPSLPERIIRKTPTKDRNTPNQREKLVFSRKKIAPAMTFTTGIVAIIKAPVPAVVKRRPLFSKIK
ncbi:MAG: hypothetical protein DDT32_01436 [Syntrophomonadaceae bacterium]|nr:hypothetical protein [Bacillota bacterium]